MTSFSLVSRGSDLLYVGTAPEDAPQVEIDGAEVRQLKAVIDETDLIHAFVATSTNSASTGAISATFDSHATPPKDGVIPECAAQLAENEEGDR